MISANLKVFGKERDMLVSRITDRCGLMHRISCFHKRKWIMGHTKEILHIVVATRIIICCGGADNFCKLVWLTNLVIPMVSSSVTPVLRTVICCLRTHWFLRELIIFALVVEIHGDGGIQH